MDNNTVVEYSPTISSFVLYEPGCFSDMLQELFDSNSRHKPGAGFVFLTRNVGSGGPAAIHSN